MLTLSMTRKIKGKRINKGKAAWLLIQFSCTNNGLPQTIKALRENIIGTNTDTQKKKKIKNMIKLITKGKKQW